MDEDERGGLVKGEELSLEALGLNRLSADMVDNVLLIDSLLYVLLIA